MEDNVGEVNIRMREENPPVITIEKKDGSTFAVRETCMFCFGVKNVFFKYYLANGKQREFQVCVRCKKKGRGRERLGRREGERGEGRRERRRDREGGRQTEKKRRARERYKVTEVQRQRDS